MPSTLTQRSESLQSADRLNTNLRACAVQASAEGLLAASAFPVLEDVEVMVTDRGVVLSGRVPSYHAKQLAQEQFLGAGFCVAENRLSVGK